MTFNQLMWLSFAVECVIFTTVYIGLACWLRKADTARKSLSFYMRQCWSLDPIDNSLSSEAKRRAGLSRAVMWLLFLTVVVLQFAPILIANWN
jgi:hypothetical protein